MPPEILPMFDEDRVQEGVSNMALALQRVIRGNGEWITLGILRGALHFYSDLLRSPELVGWPVTPHFVWPNLRKKPPRFTCGDALYDAQVILIDDICDTGNTIRALYGYLKNECGVQTIVTCVLCDRPERHPDFQIDHAGFIVPLHAGWLVGYGMDDYSGYRSGIQSIGYIETDEQQDRLLAQISHPEGH